MSWIWACIIMLLSGKPRLETKFDNPSKIHFMSVYEDHPRIKTITCASPDAYYTC